MPEREEIPNHQTRPCLDWDWVDNDLRDEWNHLAIDYNEFWEWWNNLPQPEPEEEEDEPWWVHALDIEDFDDWMA